MQVSTANDVKIYNLSHGKSLPEWMSSEARRKLEKKNFDVRRRIQLIQDFDMPDVSNTIDITPDGRYIYATGAYKPLLKCYDLNDLSLKFERGIDADIKKLLVLSEDYSKIVMLQDDRYLEMHAAFGRYCRLRMPRYGRDLAFSKECSDLYMVGAGDEVYRLNLEQGEWLAPLVTDSAGVNCCRFAEPHQLFVCGTSSGTVEAWDHRDKSRVGILDCVPVVAEYTNGEIGEVTSLAFKDALTFAVGTSTGQIILYDIRSRRPLLVKDHYNNLPIQKLDFVQREEGDVVLSLDSRVLKMWHIENGSAFAAIESENKLTDFTRYPDSGLIFFANEAPRMLQYFVPSLGTAPKWCTFLENLTEEMEESEQPSVYDDYKFVTKQQLEDVGLSHLVGSTVLRAYMHGYFINAQLYAKAHTLTQPFAYKNYKERKIRDILDKERETNAVKIKKDNLPAVNKELALRLQQSSTFEGKKNKKKDTAAAVLGDERFKKLFESEDFQLDEESEEFKKKIGQKPTAHVLDNLGDSDISDQEEASGDEEEEDEPMDHSLPQEDDANINNGVSDSDINSETDSDTGHQKKISKKEAEKRREERKRRNEEKYYRQKEEERAERERRRQNKPSKFVLHEIAAGESSKKFIEDNSVIDNKSNVSMFKRKLAVKKQMNKEDIQEDAFGGKTMSFTLEKSGKAGRAEREKEQRKKHQTERKNVARATTDSIAKKLKKLPQTLTRGMNKRL